MILTGKRGANSPAEAERKKPDEKESPHARGQGFWEVNENENESVDGASNDQEGWRLQRSPNRNKNPNQRGSPTRTFSEVAREGAARHPRNGQSMGPNPDFLHRHTTPVFETRNEGAFRDEFEIEIQTINGNPFRGSLTRQEAKHRIYKDILGCPFSNFRGIRTGFRKVPTITFMLKQPINIDEMESFQNFDYIRKYVKAGKEVEDVLQCKIRGVRTVTGDEATARYSENWTRVVKIEGCDYRVPIETIMKWLENYGEVVSELVEDVFEDDEDSEGTNATGIYAVKMKLTSDIPQLLPMDGRRIKVYYRGIQKLCTRCFGNHMSRNCSEEKVKWLDYVDNFMQTSPEIERDLFGNWNDIVERERRQKQINRDHYESKQQTQAESNQVEDHQEQAEPNLSEATQMADQPQNQQNPHEQSATQQEQFEEPKQSDFKIPESDEALVEMIDKLMDLGLSHNDATASIEKRRKAFEKAMKKYTQLKSKKYKQTKPRKESLTEK